MKRKYLIFNNSKIDFYVLQYTCGIWLRYFFPDQTTQIQIHIPRTARMESILHRCGASPFGVLASDAVVIVGGEPIPSGVLIDRLPSRIIIGSLFLEEIAPTA